MARYAELKPEELAAFLNRESPAILPIGALEWHGSHLPLGLDGLVAESFAEALAASVDGVSLPCFYTPLTPLRQSCSIRISTGTFRSLMSELVEGLIASGFHTIAIVTGHYAQPHSIELSRLALATMDSQQHVRVIACSPLEILEQEALLDHAARYETSQLLALRPDLVVLNRFKAGPPSQNAVLGESPLLGSATEGAELLEEARQKWSDQLQHGNRDAAIGFHKRRLKVYEEFSRRFERDDWEQSLDAWWSEVVSRRQSEL